MATAPLRASQQRLPRLLHRISTRLFASDTSSTTEKHTLFLVESPAKAKKIQEYLGPRYRVLASYGHIRDLPAKTGSVSPDTDFSMRWELADGARKRLQEITSSLQHADGLILATDPDREGEAISWHIIEELKERGSLLDALPPPQRITFTEVTKPAVLQALSSPRELSMPLVDAYMARRALDYLFGFHLSPLLWRKLPGARSAGRVQSAALRLVAEREAAIEAFVPQKYWTVHADIALNPTSTTGSSSTSAKDNNSSSMKVEATLVKLHGKSIAAPGILDQSIASHAVDIINNNPFTVSSITIKDTSRHPPPPFTTSTLQQEANTKLGMSATRTMQLAQKLYEAGYITYMRTDGTNIAPGAINALRDAVQQQHGQEYVPEKPRIYAKKAKNAQEAHEAIRPTDPTISPQAVRSLDLDPGTVQLYRLIVSRAMASQMSSATVKMVSAEFVDENEEVVLRSTASYVTFPGYLSAYSGDNSNSSSSSIVVDDSDEADDALDNTTTTTTNNNNASAVSIAARQRAASSLSLLQKGDPVGVKDTKAIDHETRPPGRFTEGTLVKELEKLGIGRPSTYAPTMKLLQARKYIRKEGRALHAEPLGRILTAFLCAYCPNYVDYGFTSRLEEELDDISRGEVQWKELLKEFWVPFEENVSRLGGLSGTEVIDMLNVELESMLFGNSNDSSSNGGDGDSSGSNITTTTLDSNNNSTTSTTASEETTTPATNRSSNKACPACGNPLSLKLSHKGGPFIGCSAYPQCSYTRPAVLVESTADEDSSPHSSSEFSSKGMALAEKFGMRGSVRLLGNDPTTNKEIFVRTGRFGPYIQLGIDSDHEMRRAPLPKDVNSRAVTLEYALSLLALPRSLGPHPETDLNIQVKNGKFGPYLVHGTAMRSIPKDINPLNITMERAVELLSQVKRKGKQKKESEHDETDEKEEFGAPIPKGRKKATAGKSDGGDVSPVKNKKKKTAAASSDRSATKSTVLRARSAYIFYMMDRLEQKKAEAEKRKKEDAINEDDFGASINHIEEIAKEWRLLNAEEKKPYEVKAQEDKERSRMEREELNAKMQKKGKGE